MEQKLGGDRVNQGVKVRFNYKEEVTDIYFGGVGKPDGEGHGHIRVDIHGNETIIREPYVHGAPYGRRDATLMDCGLASAGTHPLYFFQECFK